jgi:hypothetical protein
MSTVLRFILFHIAPVSGTDYPDRFNAIITKHIASIKNCHLRRDKLNASKFGTVLRRFVQEFSSETLQSFRLDQSDDFVRRQIQERDNDRLIQHLLENDKRLLAELTQLQRENYVLMHSSVELFNLVRVLKLSSNIKSLELDYSSIQLFLWLEDVYPYLVRYG